MLLAKKIDACIDKTFGIQKKLLSHDESINYTYASLCNLINSYRKSHPDNPVHKILFTGTVDAIENKNIYDKMIEKLKNSPPSENFEILVGDNLLSSSVAMNLLGQCDAVVLFEKQNQSRYDHVGDVMRTIQLMGKEILGLVLIESVN